MKLKLPSSSALWATFFFNQLSCSLPTSPGNMTQMFEGCADITHLEYTAVPGIFAQDDPNTDSDTFDFRKAFGLINQPYDTDKELPGCPEEFTQWERLAFKIKRLNENAEQHVQYKLIFAGRHGQGFHNVGEQTYGTSLWDDGNGTADWKDALLTPEGISQAEVVQQTWRNEMKKGIPLPEVYIVSPMRRCIQTANYTFADLDLPKTRPFRPVIKELLRETIGLHTCDMRSPKSVIEEFAPSYIIEPGFTEEDLLWDANDQESQSARNARLLSFLDEIFDERLQQRTDYYPVLSPQAATFVSLTAHSGAISSLLDVTHHRKFALETGAVIPILLKIERVAGARKPMKIDPPLHAPSCPAGFVPPKKS
ncbi:hypothetical protein KEM54_001624 [Ascosphaera aggregata]|nr:hypothetical protein KEM54_001624 [Ascosphaera aggregata]